MKIKCKAPKRAKRVATPQEPVGEVIVDAVAIVKFALKNKRLESLFIAYYFERFVLIV